MRITAWKSTTTSLALAAGIVTPLALSAGPAAAGTAPTSASPACSAQRPQFVGAAGLAVYQGSLAPTHENNIGAAAPAGPIIVVLHHGQVTVYNKDLPSSSASYEHVEGHNAQGPVHALLWHTYPRISALHAEACNASGQVTTARVEIATYKGNRLTTDSLAYVTRDMPANG